VPFPAFLRTRPRPRPDRRRPRPVRGLVRKGAPGHCRISSHRSRLSPSRH